MANNVKSRLCRW